MAFEEQVKLSFKKAKEDAEGIKNELAFLTKRIAKIEESMNAEVLRKLIENSRKKKK